MFETLQGAELTIEEMADIHPSRYLLCDVRDEISFRYGAIPGAEGEKHEDHILRHRGGGGMARRVLRL